MVTRTTTGGPTASHAGRAAAGAARVAAPAAFAVAVTAVVGAGREATTRRTAYSYCRPAAPRRGVARGGQSSERGRGTEGGETRRTGAARAAAQRARLTQGGVVAEVKLLDGPAAVECDRRVCGDVAAVDREPDEGRGALLPLPLQREPGQAGAEVARGRRRPRPGAAPEVQPQQYDVRPGDGVHGEVVVRVPRSHWVGGERQVCADCVRLLRERLEVGSGTRPSDGRVV